MTLKSDLEQQGQTILIKLSFFNRYVNAWNSLPNSVMSASSLDSFEILLLNYLCKEP